MTTKQRREFVELGEIIQDLEERIGGDPYVTYCENDEELDDLKPMMEMAADRARLKVASARLLELGKLRHEELEKRRQRKKGKK